MTAPGILTLPAPSTVTLLGAEVEQLRREVDNLRSSLNAERINRSEAERKLREARAQVAALESLTDGLIDACGDFADLTAEQIASLGVLGLNVSHANAKKAMERNG